MKIVLAAHRYLPSIGGTEQAVASLAGAFVAQGRDVTVVTAAEPGLSEEEVIEGVQVHRLPLVRVAGYRFPRGYLRYLRSSPYDCLHVHGQRVWTSDLLLPFVKRFTRPKVFTPHGFYQWHMKRSWREYLYYRGWFARRVRYFDRVVALTGGERQTLLSWGLPSTRAALIPQGVDPLEFERSNGGYLASRGIDRRPIILYAGGFYPNKRVDLLIRSMAAAHLDACLVAVGPEGPTAYGLEYCMRLAAELGVEAHFLGAIPRRDLVSLYHDADILALPSLFEGFGLVLLEALASGIPFVSPAVGAAEELAKKGGGLVVADIAGMGDAISALLSDDARRKHMGGLGRKIANEYTWEKVAGSHLELYDEILLSQRPRKSR